MPSQPVAEEPRPVLAATLRHPRATRVAIGGNRSRMPTSSPARPCTRTGCPELAPCPVHGRAVRERAYQQSRPSAAERGYGSAWARIRATYARLHPLCEQCAQPTTEIHHRVPLSQGGTHAWANLIALCASCHDRAHRATRWGSTVFSGAHTQTPRATHARTDGSFRAALPGWGSR